MAVDELAVHAEGNMRLLAALRSSTIKLSGGDRKRAAELVHAMQGKESMRGRHWLLETDLKDGSTLKLDKTSKSILIILRQLGRLQEVRCI